VAPEQIVIELIAASEVGPDLALKMEARAALLRYVAAHAVHLILLCQMARTVSQHE